jgi:hypothetical protein
MRKRVATDDKREGRTERKCEIEGKNDKRRKEFKDDDLSPYNICRTFKEPKNRFPAWRNRFLDSVNVYKYGLRAGRKKMRNTRKESYRKRTLQ